MIINNLFSKYDLRSFRSNRTITFYGTLVTCLFFEMPHFSIRKKFEMPHISLFQNEIGKMGHFKIFSYRKMGHFEKNDTWLVLKREMNRKWNCSNLGHFKIKCIWPHVKNTSFTCFLGHFMIPRVFFPPSRHTLSNPIQ